MYVMRHGYNIEPLNCTAVQRLVRGMSRKTQ